MSKKGRRTRNARRIAIRNAMKHDPNFKANYEKARAAFWKRETAKLPHEIVIRIEPEGAEGVSVEEETPS